MHKICKICRKRFDDENNLFQCQSCIDFREYKKKFTKPHNTIDYTEIEFVFFPRMHYNAMRDIGKVYGSYNHHLDRIRINLFAFSDKINIEEITCKIYVHEVIHRTLTLEHGGDVSNAYDNISEKLEDYLGLSFRNEY